jgi:hypothetical protein
VLVGSQRGENIQPLPGRAVVVEVMLLALGCLANAALEHRITDNDKMPGLQVGAAWGAGGGAQAILDYCPIYGALGEATHTAPPLHLRSEGLCMLPRFGR